jgi:hypothetical protein
MQTLATFIGTAACILLAAGCTKDVPAIDSEPGAYTTAAVTDPNVLSAAAFAIDGNASRCSTRQPRTRESARPGAESGCRNQLLACIGAPSARGSRLS